MDDSASGLEGWLDSPSARKAAQALTAGQARLILVSADSEAIASQRAAALARHAKVLAVAFMIGASPADDRLALLHALARGAVPIFQISAPESGTAASAPDFQGFPCPVLVCVRQGTGVPACSLPLLGLSIEPLPASTRARLWQDTLPELASQSGILAARYNVEPAAARHIAIDARAMAGLGEGGMDLETVADCVRVRSVSTLAAGVQVIRPTAR